ncbi:MAG: YfhO family protein [Candidatus Marinimicrobia bacterium]|nr:YfhO family protein [Candidatus Neomarinimicrobiota bacterium]
MNRKYIPLLIGLITALFIWKMIVYGYIPMANDMVANKPIKKWVNSTTEFPQWFPNLFSGMPSYGGYIYTPGDPTKTILNLLFLNRGIRIWFYLTLGGLGLFNFIRFLGKSTFPALLGGLSYALTPYGFGLINAGHNNKIMAMAFIPWVLMGAFQVIRKPTLKSVLILSLVTALQFWANHPQIVYYTWMVIGFYSVWTLVFSVKEKSFSAKVSGKQISGILAGLFLALLMVSDPYMDIYEFQKHSNRGAKSVLDQTGQTESGTDWNYATQWSFHPKETISFLLPYHYGLQNFSTRDIKSAAYWGYMPFTQSTHYLGLVAIIFSILGALLKKPEKLEWFFWVTTLLVLVTGFGSFFPILYKPFYSLFPFFSKFRVPSMIYVLLAVTIPILAAFGFDSLMERVEKKDSFKKVLYVAGGIAGLSILFLIIGESVFSFSVAKDARYSPTILPQLQKVRFELFQKGLLLALAVSLGSLGLVWGIIQKKINRGMFGYLLIGLVVLDLWIVNVEFLHLKPSKNMDLLFQEDPIIKYLNSDDDHFRIFPADELNSNKYSYWNLESIGGYHPVKLRNYQDLMDAKGFSRPQILDMLNVKYVLTRKKINNPNFITLKDVPGIFENINVLPKAWIVGNVKSVETQRESLMETLLNGFDPSNTAIIYKYQGEPLNGMASGQVDVISRSENKINIMSQSETGGLLVLSEIYYKPGWRAYVNGEETPVYQTNHILRSIYVPSGEHQIEFRYDDSSWKQTRILSRVSFLAILFGFGCILWKEKENSKLLH